MKKYILKVLGFNQCNYCSGWFDRNSKDFLGFTTNLITQETKQWCVKCNPSKTN